MNYDVCYCKGAKTQEVAEKLLKYFGLEYGTKKLVKNCKNWESFQFTEYVLPTLKTILSLSHKKIPIG